MRSVVARPVGNSAALLVAAGLCALVLAAPNAHAQSGTTVKTTVCGYSQTAHIVIVSPLSNTSTNTNKVTVSGELTQITQLTAYIDGTFSEVIPIDSNATTFTYAYMPPVGEHTLRLEGQDLCQRTTPVAELVLTYNPALPPKPITGPAPAEPSAVASQATARAQEVIANRPIDEVGASDTILPGILHSARNGIFDALAGLGIISRNPAESVRLATRFTMLTTGTLLIMFAGSLLKLFTSVLPKAVKGIILSSTPSWVAAHARLSLSLIGLGLVVAGFLLAGV